MKRKDNVKNNCKGIVHSLFIVSLCLGNSNMVQAQNTDVGINKVKQCLPANKPVGNARGIFPGRVAWSHAPGAAKWDGEGMWFEDRWNNQESCDWLMENTLCSLTGAESVQTA